MREVISIIYRAGAPDLHALVYVLAALALFGGPLPVQLKANDPLAAALDEHKASRQLIDPLTCRVRFEQVEEGKPNRKTVWEAKYYRSQSRVRVQARESGSQFDRLIENNTLSTYSTGKNTRAIVLHEGIYLPRHDPFVEGLMAINKPNTLEYYDLEMILEKCRIEKSGRDENGDFELSLTHEAGGVASKIQMSMRRKYNLLIDWIS